MQELGAHLQQARMAKGLDLEDVGNLTKIRLSYLRAIEDGDFDRLPDDVYLRGFLRSYAKAVGLDPSEVIAHYEYALFPPDYVDRTAARRKRAEQRKKQRTWALLLFIGVAALVALYVHFVGW